MTSQQEYSTYLNMDAFILSMVIMVCIVLSIAICMLIWFKDRDYKYSSTYLIFILLAYQTSSLLAFYSPPQLFENVILVKMISAFLLKSAVLIWMAAYIKKDSLTHLFTAVHLLSVLAIWPLFFTPLRDAFVSISPPNIAIYEDGSRVYTVISSIVYIACGILFYVTNTTFRQKRRYLIFLLGFISLNMGFLIFGSFFSQDVLYEKMHVFVLFVLLAVLFRLTPYLEKKDWILTSANFMQGMGETALILDGQGNVVYSHNEIKRFDIASHLVEIGKEIEKQKDTDIEWNLGCGKHELNKEGEIRVGPPGKHIDLQYKVTPLYYRKVCFGNIIVLRDITASTEAVHKLREKNLLLQEALKRQEEYIRVSRRIKGEEERGRILGQVNNMTRNYLNSLKLWVFQLDRAVSVREHFFKDRIKKQNEEMLLLTRKMIEEARQSVRQLNNIVAEEKEAPL